GAGVAEGPRPVLDLQNQPLLLSGDLDSRALQRFERRRRIVDEDVDLGLSASARHRTQAGDVRARLAEDVTDAGKLSGLIVQIERQVGCHDRLLSYRLPTIHLRTPRHILPLPT